jgi:uncharacterized protein (TIGR02117 family)
VGFVLTAWIGAAIPRNYEWREPDGGVTIMVASNGVHTEIIMPVRAEGIDWAETFPRGDLGDPARDYSHVAVSWGERSFFLETPTWSDFNPVTALGALAGGDALLHVAWYRQPAASETRRSFRIGAEEYRRLARSIAADLAPAQSRASHPGYGQNDRFYSARGAYHLGNTCNQWTSDRLAGAGVRTGAWTPLPGGVMQWVPAFP